VRSFGVLFESSGKTVRIAGFKSADTIFQFFSSSVSPHMPLKQS
jgi:hypothetical protein